MTESSKKTQVLKVLRTQAEEKLMNGGAPPTHGWLTNVDALNLLHKMASTPGSASDALKLLHELQVHQVELDLQHEQLEASERELNEDLIHTARLYDFAPAACFSVSLQGQITRVNFAAAKLWGEDDRTELIGRHIDEFLAPESRSVLEKLVGEVREGVLDASCEVRTSAGADLHVKAGLVPGESSMMMMFVNLAHSTRTDKRA